MSDLTMDLSPYWDRNKTCRNPHRGWYVHYFTNTQKRYGASIQPDDDLSDLPGLTHLYLRLPWSDLEPAEGEFRWDILDDVIERWEPRGFTFGFRVSCKETGPDHPYATPEWVERAGARGVWCPKTVGHDAYRALDPVTAVTIGMDWKNWEPDYGDPVFLEKLEAFHTAFAARYAKRPYVDYIDIGSYGDWGEGHTWFGSRKKWAFEVIQTHIDLHRRVYPGMIIEGNDRLIRDRIPDDGSGKKVLDYMLESGLALRDDAPGQTPSYADLFWRKRHVDVETTHYSGCLYNLQKQGKGKAEYDAYLREELDATHATYYGFHGYPRQWLEANADIAKELSNRIGYWIFPASIKLHMDLHERSLNVDLAWENHGVAPPYRGYQPQIGLFDVNDKPCAWLALDGGDSRSWMPGERVVEQTRIEIPASIAGGAYRVALRLVHPASGRLIELGLQRSLEQEPGVYLLPDVTVEVPAG